MANRDASLVGANTLSLSEPGRPRGIAPDSLELGWFDSGRRAHAELATGDRPKRALGVARGDDRSAAATGRTQRQPPERQLTASANWRSRPVAAVAH